MQKLKALTLPGYICVCIFQLEKFWALFISFELNGLLQSIWFWMFYSKHLITFKNRYLLSCWFHRVDIFRIKFRLSEIFAVVNLVSRILNLELLSVDLPFTYTSCFMLVKTQMFSIFHLAFLRFTFHWHLHWRN